MVKKANKIYNILFFCCMMLAILSIECKVIQILNIENFIFCNLFICVLSISIMLATSFTAARHLHRYFAHLQKMV